MMEEVFDFRAEDFSHLVFVMAFGDGDGLKFLVEYWEGFQYAGHVNDGVIFEKTGPGAGALVKAVGGGGVAASGDHGAEGEENGFFIVIITVAVPGDMALFGGVKEPQGGPVSLA